ncbi:4-hydroxyphenylpyruvate dioxygenase [Streptomyces kaniharaensis]|uniref:4-hydroxyphenylpyruvate dioxygenase n=1 Tax=Streptomyces kaniharaensis TaxID=212423 RepID=A0A6N7KVX1_9ACTN|nr:4-hydroxyphenylpyruvate dioxygenase [Streptomyces kaniharaensis]MQS15792.1 4-hydroxyphenylpyruvate dioxygenase [Streptomyces kaniharaensis]
MTFSPAFGISHVEFYVADVDSAAAELTDRYGFRPVARAASAQAQSLALRQGRIVLVLTQARSPHHPGADYVLAHGDGVADIALTVTDVPAVFDEAVSRGAVPLAVPRRHPDGRTTAVLAGFGDVVHTLVEPGPTGLPPGFTALPDAVPERDDELLEELDHFAVCLLPGELERTVDFYTRVLGFRMVFQELIRVGAQAMDSKVVQSRTGEVTLTLIEPDTSAEPGQIDRFLAEHGGCGVQHVAFASRDIVRAVGTLRDRGVEFLSVPDAYYTMLADRLDLARHSTSELHEINVLVDEDHDGQLFQIFTRSTHPRRTLFHEVIERFGARTFGNGNIKALYEAVEAERLDAGAVPR